MALLLNVPYEEKDQAKAAGAIWNHTLKKWIAPTRRVYYRFMPWFPGDTIALDSIYIIEQSPQCPTCSKRTPVYISQ